MNESITAYIDDLFRYIEVYEKDYARFETEAFFQTYNGIYAVFQTLRQQRETALKVDRVFLEKVKQWPLSSSDLRQLTIQILISFFESVADTDGKSNRAYLYCRDLRSTKRDVAFFESYLMPLLTRAGNLNNNYKLNNFFLQEIGRFIKDFSGRGEDEISPEEFNALPVHRKLLELSLRRSGASGDPLKDRNSLEFHLKSMGIFEKLRQNGPLFEHYLLEWDYLADVKFLDRVKKTIIVLWEKLKGLFSNFGYFRLSLTQRNAAYLYYALIMLIFIFLALFIPQRWNGHKEKKLVEFEERVRETRKDLGP